MVQLYHKKQIGTMIQQKENSYADKGSNESKNA